LFIEKVREAIKKKEIKKTKNGIIKLVKLAEEIPKIKPTKEIEVQAITFLILMNSVKNIENMFFFLLIILFITKIHKIN
jgi:hypothetical protein